jgi:hypothetical protein
MARTASNKLSAVLKASYENPQHKPTFMQRDGMLPTRCIFSPEGGRGSIAITLPAIRA